MKRYFKKLDKMSKNIHAPIPTENIRCNTFKALVVYKASKLKKPLNFSGKFKVQQQINSKTKSERNLNSIADSDVLCVNCMKMIKSSLAVDHSLCCNKVLSEVLLLDQCSIIQQADYKVRHLMESLTQLKNDKELCRIKDNEYAIQMLGVYCSDALAITEFTKGDILKCREVIYNLMLLIKGFKSSPRIMIYMERLLVITKEKYGQLINYYKDIGDTDSLKMKSKKELESIVFQKTEQLRKSIYTMSEARMTSITERSSQMLNPMQIKDLKESNADVNSDAGVNEYRLF